ncbi:MAG: NAD(P)H-dependent oxidoreductase [Gammaproteobacteria bacterium]|nr:NAD(P)H-dependent oxidoreductase [Gammaproteobacteria bacterium]
MQGIRLLGISGSIRRESANTAVLEAIRAQLAAGSGPTLTLFGLGQIPLYNSDLEGEHLPGPVHALKEAVTACDGLVLCSPEYNHAASGVLKNAIDWVSRPAYQSPLVGKPVLIITAATSPLGGVRVISQLREVLASCLARVVATRDVVVPKVHEKIVDGRFVDKATLASASRAIDHLVQEIRLLRP